MGRQRQSLSAEIQSLLPAGHGYLTGISAVSDAHESTHGVNSRLRGRYGNAGGGRPINAFFVGRDSAFVLTEPRVRLSWVQRYVPAECRGASFGLYLQQQAGQWDTEPLYILDEWTAYTNGADVGLQAGRPEAFELQQAIEFCGYATALLICVEKHDKAYPDAERKKLQEFIGWQCERVERLAAKAKAMAANGGAGAAAWSPGCAAALGNFQRRFVKHE